ncbi:Major facilitator superfamily domain containing protein [Amanita muscaria]
MAEEHSSDSSAHGAMARNATFSLDQCREAALAEIDEAKFSWFHVKVCLVAGIGFFTDAYDIFVINLASTMFGFLPESYDELSTSELRDFCLKVATPVGTLFGQVIFGWLADRMGRKKMYGIELMIMIVGTFGQALAGATQTVSLVGTLIVWRFIMGVGVGGDYPSTACRKVTV